MKYMRMVLLMAGLMVGAADLALAATAKFTLTDTPRSLVRYRGEYCRDPLLGHYCIQATPYSLINMSKAVTLSRV